jgi:hypothetical protein
LTVGEKKEKGYRMLTDAGKVECRSSGVVMAKKRWDSSAPIDFMWMPAGRHTITASYGRGSQNVPIELTVMCDEGGANNVANSFTQIRANSPRRPPYICIEHKAQERAAEPVGFKWGTIKHDGGEDSGIICTCQPSAMGEQSVNGNIFSSFSPTFDTDAEYDTLACSGCNQGLGGCTCSERHVFRFKTGARGSAANPARVTRLDAQSVGSLTNWPAFKDILPVAASEPQWVKDGAKPDALASLKARVDAAAAAELAVKARQSVEERIVNEGRVTI